ncbi:MAG: hypothetical protein ABSC51_01560 [Gaiellaceae bacterium]
MTEPSEKLDSRWPLRRDDPPAASSGRPVSVRCAFCPSTGFVGSLEEGREWFERHRARYHSGGQGGVLHVEVDGRE